MLIQSQLTSSSEEELLVPLICWMDLWSCWTNWLALCGLCHHHLRIPKQREDHWAMTLSCRRFHCRSLAFWKTSLLSCSLVGTDYATLWIVMSTCIAVLHRHWRWIPLSLVDKRSLVPPPVGLLSTTLAATFGRHTGRRSLCFVRDSSLFFDEFSSRTFTLVGQPSATCR